MLSATNKPMPATVTVFMLSLAINLRVLMIREEKVTAPAALIFAPAPRD